MITKNTLEVLRWGSDEVFVYNKATNKHFIKKIFRKYISVGKIPLFDPTHPKSYMFSRDGSLEKDYTFIPEQVSKIIDDIKNKEPLYNQFVVNLYRNGDDFMEPHSDCDKDMIEGYNILIHSLGETRTLRFTNRFADIRGQFEIDLVDGSTFIINEFLNKNFRHEILKSNTLIPRVSITARQMRF